MIAKREPITDAELARVEPRAAAKIEIVVSPTSSPTQPLARYSTPVPTATPSRTPPRSSGRRPTIARSSSTSRSCRSCSNRPG